MKEELNDIRVKLHITTSRDKNVKNVWMCLNYGQKPTIGHIVEHIKHMHSVETSKQQKCTGGGNDDDDSVRLYLEDFWLPPAESSRLIRENDCIKVSIKYPTAYSFGKESAALASRVIDQTSLSTNFARAVDEQRVERNYNRQRFYDCEDWDDADNSFNISNNINNNNNSRNNGSQLLFTSNKFSDYLQESTKQQQQQTSIDTAKAKIVQSTHVAATTVAAPSAKQTIVDESAKPKAAASSSTKYPLAQTAATSAAATSVTAPSLPPQQKTNATKPVVKCFKKFSIGAFAHLLNEDVVPPSEKSTTGSKDNKSKTKKLKKKDNENDQDTDGLSEEQIIDDYYHSLQHIQKQQESSKLTNANSNNNNNNNNNNTKTTYLKSNPKADDATVGGEQIISESVDLDRIADKLKSSGKLKWKNSSKPTSANGPKHIIFASSSESSEAEETSDAPRKPVTQSQQCATSVDVPKGDTSNGAWDASEQKATSGGENANSNRTSNYYEPTKEEQLNAVSYNRSFVIENPKSLGQFKKVFNESKLHVPLAEQVFCNPNGASGATAVTAVDVKPSQTNEQQLPVEHVKEDLDMSTSSTSSSGSDSSSDSSGSSGDSNSISSNAENAVCENAGKMEAKETKTKRRNKRLPSLKVDYEKFESLVGPPRVDDKIAFQILEISSNFTPEISNYKNGTVTEFDTTTNEVTLRLYSKYNSVLKKANKFNVVFDDSETEKQAEKDYLLNNEKDLAEEPEEILKVDWRNLMNMKIVPKVDLVQQPSDNQIIQN